VSGTTVNRVGLALEPFGASSVEKYVTFSNSIKDLVDRDNRASGPIVTRRRWLERCLVA
jgi:hypothetical protein